jgi:hypothetical protein
MKKTHIFVQCASYRDPALRHTIQSAFKNASKPERVSFGICWQGHLNELRSHLSSKYFNKSRIVLIKAEETKGIGYARHKAQNMFENEEYTLQIDSHMHFLPHWDEMCINMLRQCPSEKPLLTTYLTDHTKEEEPMCFRLGAENISATKNVVIVGASGIMQEKKPIKGILASAHFVFSRSELYDDCPIDPRMQFLYEETLIAPRAYTNGWDIYHPHLAPLQHRWNRSYRRTNWQDINTATLESRGESVYNRVISGEIKGKYGMGNVRNFSNYERYSGINFKKGTLTANAREGIPNLKRLS